MPVRHDFDEGPSLLRVVLALAAVTAVGTVGLAWLEGWPLERALYFTVISITTVGYGDEGISESGRNFALLLILCGMGIASYALMLIVKAAADAPPYWRRRMQKSIESTRDHTILCGYGRMGEAIAARLAAESHAVVVVEAAEPAFRAACEAGHLALHGAATEDAVLARAGIERASALVSCVDSELENIVVTLSARAARADLLIVARAEAEQQVRKLRRAGANRIVSPFQSGGNEAARMILEPSAPDLLGGSLELGAVGIDATGEVAVAEIEIEEGSALAGVTLGDYRRGTRLSFVSLARSGKQPEIPPHAEAELRPGDRLVVAGDLGQVTQIRSRSRAG